MARGSLPPFFLISNLLVWASAVIVMGILSYFISVTDGHYISNHIIYEEVIVSHIIMFMYTSSLETFQYANQYQ